jgi:hypothetical protein
VENAISNDKKEWCFEMKDKYNILPGQSFGSLPEEQHNVYLVARCYRYFCQPNAMAGKGVFKCIPLTNSTRFD